MAARGGGAGAIEKQVGWRARCRAPGSSRGNCHPRGRKEAPPARCTGFVSLTEEQKHKRRSNDSEKRERPGLDFVPFCFCFILCGNSCPRGAAAFTFVLLFIDRY